MSLQIVMTNRQNRRFIVSLVLAGLLHALILTYTVFTMRGSFQDYKVDMIFWGCILRKQDMQPQVFMPVREVSKTLLLEPSKLLNVVQAKGWQLGVTVDKPGVPQNPGHGQLPPKFLTKRVDIDEDTTPEEMPGIPDAPRIPLRMQAQ